MPGWQKLGSSRAARPLYRLQKCEANAGLAGSWPPTPMRVGTDWRRWARGGSPVSTPIVPDANVRATGLTGPRKTSVQYHAVASIRIILTFSVHDGSAVKKIMQSAVAVPGH